MKSEEEQDCIILAKKLVACPSQTGKETEILFLIEDFLRSNGFLPRRIPVSKGRWDLLVRAGSRGKGVLLAGHCDTVDLASKVLLKGDRLFGIGSSDMKGSLAAFLSAFANSPSDTLRGLVITVGEESGKFDGAFALLKRKKLFKGFSFAIVGEPTNLSLMDSQPGLAGFRAIFKGKERHTANLLEGKQPVHEAAEFISKFSKRRLGIFSANFISGGSPGKSNIIPDRVRLEVDRRVDFSERLDNIERELIADLSGRNASFRREGVWMEPVSSRESLPAVSFLREDCALRLKTSKQTFFTELPFFARLGLSPICLGAGEPLEAHTPNESASVSKIIRLCEISEKIVERKRDD